jgi:hypothetical protein
MRHCFSSQFFVAGLGRETCRRDASRYLFGLIIMRPCIVPMAGIAGVFGVVPDSPGGPSPAVASQDSSHHKSDHHHHRGPKQACPHGCGQQIAQHQIDEHYTVFICFPFVFFALSHSYCDWLCARAMLHSFCRCVLG